MGFWLKKVIEFWLMPLPACLVLLTLAGWRLRQVPGARVARGLVGLALICLVLGSNNLVSSWLVAPLENAYAPIPDLPEGAPPPPELANCRFVAVLGAGHGDRPDLAALDKLSYPGLERLIEAVRLLRHLPAARLIVSGPSIGEGVTHASVLASAARSLGVAPERIIQIDTAHDTEDESLAIARLVTQQRVALVTSAVHLPRAAALFRHARVDFFPCPTDFTAKLPPRFDLSQLRCDSESLDRTTTFVRERLGELWLRLRGRW